jgi:uncharacterized phage-associated protein
MEPTAPYDARAIANLLLDLADERGVRLTQMSVLKLIYFAHGWYLAIHNKPLCAHQFEAWQYGPVLKVVRDAFKEYGNLPIRSRATKLIVTTGEFIEVPPHVQSNDRDFIQSVFDEYRGHSAWTLSEMTHEAGSPWDKLWNTQSPVGRMALRIRNEEIRSHFRDLPRRFVLS